MYVYTLCNTCICTHIHIYMNIYMYILSNTATSNKNFRDASFPHTRPHKHVFCFLMYRPRIHYGISSRCLRLQYDSGKCSGACTGGSANKLSQIPARRWSWTRTAVYSASQLGNPSSTLIPVFGCPSNSTCSWNSQPDPSFGRIFRHLSSVQGFRPSGSPCSGVGLPVVVS